MIIRRNTQNLHYADGPGTPLYNGMVSAMSWMTGRGETRLRGYRYSYDSLGRLTEAVYGENTTLSSDPNRYTERVLEYTANGNIRRFQRHGLKDDGKYGKIDNLHLTYEGNQLKSVLDDADDVTRYASADFPDLTDGGTEYTYDECGALTSDTNQGIFSISYDNLGNPRLMRFRSGAETEYVYTPAGQKVREIHREPDTGVLKAIISPGITPGLAMKADTTDYVGPTIYRSDHPEMVRYGGGFAKLTKSGGKYVPDFYHYVTDYLGNNRAVVRASTGVLDQITHYYAWGSVYGDLGSGSSLQPFKFGDKELDLSNGVARYDYSARAYFAAIPRFDRVDNSAVKYAHQSPYIFCGNNPVNNIDPDGNDIVILSYENDDRQHLAMLIQNQDGKWEYFSVNGNNVYVSGQYSGGRAFNDVGVGEWDTPQDFLDSSYNMRENNTKYDKGANHFGYTQGYRIETSQEQDAKISNAFKAISTTEYHVISNNCATAVQKAMLKGGIPVSEPTYEPNLIPVSTQFGLVSVQDGIRMTCDIGIWPSSVYKSIIKANPGGKFYNKTK